MSRVPASSGAGSTRLRPRVHDHSVASGARARGLAPTPRTEGSDHPNPVGPAARAAPASARDDVANVAPERLVAPFRAGREGAPAVRVVAALHPVSRRRRQRALRQGARMPARSHEMPRLRTLVSGDLAAVRLAVLLQMTLPGAPCVYYGDEIGMEGGNDPDCPARLPGRREGRDEALRATFRDLIALRRAHPALRADGVRVVAALGACVALVRAAATTLSAGGETLLVVVNAGADPVSIPLEVPELAGDAAHGALRGRASGRHTDGDRPPTARWSSPSPRAGGSSWPQWVEPILGLLWQISRSSRPTPAARNGSSGLSTPMADPARAGGSWALRRPGRGPVRRVERTGAVARGHGRPADDRGRPTRQPGRDGRRERRYRAGVLGGLRRPRPG